MLTGPAAAAGLALINAVANVGSFAGPYAVGWVKDFTGSFSLGIADAVTILAATAAQADAAATVIANAVDLPGHPAIVRTPANELQLDSDLGDRRVTRAVGALSQADIAEALNAGAAQAQRLLAAGLIVGAALHVQGETRVIAPDNDAPLAAKRHVQAVRARETMDA